jgi:hypothetical protein
MIREISYSEALAFRNNINKKITGIYFISKNCSACKHVIDNLITPLSENEFKDTIDFYTITIDGDDRHNIPFPPLRTPVGYFFIKGRLTIREGAAPMNIITDELNKMVSIYNGDLDFDATFTPSPEVDDGKAG